MAGPDRHGRGRRGARRVQEAPHAVIRRIYAATVTPRVFQVWEVSGDREYRICRVYSGTVYNRCIISICQFYASITVPIHGRDPASGGRNRGSAYSRTHASRAARRLPSRDRHRPDRSAVSRAPRPEVRSRGARSGPPPGSRPVEKRTRGAAPDAAPRGRGGRRAGDRASAGERVNRTKPDNRRATGTAGRGVRQHGRCCRFFCGHVHVVRTQAPHRKRTSSPAEVEVHSPHAFTMVLPTFLCVQFFACTVP